MKSILLTTTALVAFAGAAAADGHTSVTHTLGATLGYTNNDNVDSNDLSDATRAEDNFGDADYFGEDGFFWEGNLKTNATAALDNGLTANGYFEITISEDNTNDGGDDDGAILSSSDFLLSLESDTASLFFGDTETAAKSRWVSAGDMGSDGFSEDLDSSVLRGDVTVAGANASISYIVDDASNTAEQLSFGANATFGAFSLAAAYQEDTDYVDGGDDFNADEIYGVSASATFANITATVAYAENSTDDVNSTGIKLSYPVGPVTLAAYYVEESGGANEDPNYGVNVAYAAGPIAASVDYQDDQGTQKYVAEGSYDLGNGLTVLAGALNENEGDDVDFFAGGTYALGAGAVASIVYASDVDGDQADEIGSAEYDPGLTVKVDFTF